MFWNLFWKYWKEFASHCRGFLKESMSELRNSNSNNCGCGQQCSSGAVEQWQYGVMKQTRELIASERLISVLTIYSIPRTSYPVITQQLHLWWKHSFAFKVLSIYWCQQLLLLLLVLRVSRFSNAVVTASAPLLAPDPGGWAGAWWSPGLVRGNINTKWQPSCRHSQLGSTGELGDVEKT